MSNCMSTLTYIRQESQAKILNGSDCSISKCIPHVEFCRQTPSSLGLCVTWLRFSGKLLHDKVLLAEREKSLNSYFIDESSLVLNL